MSFRWVVDVAFTTHRPVRPDEAWSRVVVWEPTAIAAERTALLMVAGRPGVVMPTRSEIVAVEL